MHESLIVLFTPVFPGNSDNNLFELLNSHYAIMILLIWWLIIEFNFKFTLGDLFIHFFTFCTDLVLSWRRNVARN